MSSIIFIFKRYPVAIICALISIVGAGVIIMRGGVLGSLSAKEEELSLRLGVIESNSKTGRGIENDLESLQAAVKDLEGRVFDREKRAINTNFFYAFADGMGVAVTQVTQQSIESRLFSKGGARELSLHSTIAYDITAIGPHAALLAFMHKFHEVDEITRVSSFSVVPDQKSVASGGEPELRLTMEVLVLSQKN